MTPTHICHIKTNSEDLGEDRIHWEIMAISFVRRCPPSCTIYLFSVLLYSIFYSHLFLNWAFLVPVVSPHSTPVSMKHVRDHVIILVLSIILLCLNIRQISKQTTVDFFVIYPQARSTISR